MTTPSPPPSSTSPPSSTTPRAREGPRHEGRTVLQWDKDDCERAGLVKIDLLGLGMLSALHRTIVLVNTHHGADLTLATIPPGDTAVYDMLCAADAIGVFQVESRAQLQT